ncbi:hypothetical protein [Bacteroides sp. 224]|uniref:hypothetical protein n=1 Tax=Bacteroides sp. 224 TaxID=2302936 RepID=UPI0013CF521C|nr:hypothetical protein [Bacteroides sp. 224]NDV64045.1 hypothetical protein [Bacteroides sp. 224]
MKTILSVSSVSETAKCIFLLCFLCIADFSLAQDTSHDNGDELIVRVGIQQANLRFENSTGVHVTASYFPFEGMVSANAMFARTNAYWTYNPCTVIGVTGNMLFKNDVMRLIFTMLSLESMGVNLPLTDNIEVQPYWSLLRVSKYKEQHNNRVTGAFGLTASYYFKNILLTGFGEYNFGYGNGDWWAENITNLFKGEDNQSYDTQYKRVRTPYKGWVFGLTVGYRIRL